MCTKTLRLPCKRCGRETVFINFLIVKKAKSGKKRISEGWKQFGMEKAAMALIRKANRKCNLSVRRGGAVALGAAFVQIKTNTSEPLDGY